MTKNYSSSYENKIKLSYFISFFFRHDLAALCLGKINSTRFRIVILRIVIKFEANMMI